MQNPWDKEFLEPPRCTEGTALPSSPHTPRVLHTPSAPIVPSASQSGCSRCLGSKAIPAFHAPLWLHDGWSRWESTPWRRFVFSWGWGYRKFQLLEPPSTPGAENPWSQMLRKENFAGKDTINIGETLQDLTPAPI